MKNNVLIAVTLCASMIVTASCWKNDITGNNIETAATGTLKGAVVNVTHKPEALAGVPVQLFGNDYENLVKTDAEGGFG